MARSHCSHCGAAVPARSPACPECGSDDATGWASDEELHEAAWAEDDEESYQDVIRSLPGGEAKGAAVGSREWTLGIIAVIVLVAFLWSYIF